MENYLGTILSPIITYYLPIEDINIKISISLLISLLLSKLFSKMDKFNYGFLTYFTRTKSITIDEENPFFEKMMDYINDKHGEKIKTALLRSENGRNKLYIESLVTGTSVEEDYGSHKIKLELSFENLQSRDSVIKCKNIIVSSKSPICVVKEYIEEIMRKTNRQTSNNLSLYKLSVNPNNKNGNNESKIIQWKKYKTKTNKNINNTIVSDEIEDNFYKDVEKFINNEEYYNTKGLPYKRGYILYGPPGCGKTSLVKVIANEFKLPIFILDLSVLKDNSELTKVVNEIYNYITPDQKYILLMEDVDRSNVFGNNNYYSPNRITADCILNILDGIDDNFGRICVMTTNDLERIKTMKSLIRPGRIDSQVYVGYCTIPQIKRIITFYYNINDFDKLPNINEKIVISASQLIKLISIFNEPNKLINFINKFLNFENKDLDKMFSDEKKIQNIENPQNLELNESIHLDNNVTKEDSLFVNSLDVRKIITCFKKINGNIIDNLNGQCKKNQLLIEQKKIESEIAKIDLQILLNKINYKDKKEQVSDNIKKTNYYRNYMKNNNKDLIEGIDNLLKEANTITI